VSRENHSSKQSVYALRALVISFFWLVSCGNPVPVSGPASLSDTPTQPNPVQSLPAPLHFSEPTQNIRFGRIGVSGGLSQGVVNCILQDRQGFIWVGTQDGLNRYDGYTFKVFRSASDDPRSINDRWINTLFQDEQGYIWIGTRLGGLNRYDPVTGLFTYYVNDPTNPSSLINNRVQVVFEDSQGNLWVGTAEGLDRFSPARNGFEHYNFNTQPASERSSDNITAILEDGYGRLWIGTAYAGLNLYSQETDSFINYSQENSDPSTLSSNRIRSIQEDPSGALWVATDNGLNQFHPQTGLVTRFQYSPLEPSSLASNSVQVVFVDENGSVWIGTSAGLDRFDKSLGGFVHYRNDPMLETSLSNDDITAIGESSDGILWVGTSGGGLNKYYRGQDRFMYYHYSADDPLNLSGNIVRKISIDRNGDIWIATNNGGLDRLAPQTGLVTRFLNDPNDPDSLSSNEVWSIYSDHNGFLWVGTSMGLDMLAEDSTSFVHYQHIPGDRTSLIGSPVYTIMEDNGLNLWLGTEFGLDRFDPYNRVFIHHQNDSGNIESLSGNEIWMLYKDRSGTLWIGTVNDGLNRYEPTTGHFVRYQQDPADPGSISSNSILSIYQDSHGTLWVGTDGGGINRFDSATDSFIHFSEEDGLPNSVIYGIQEDRDGFLWLSTNQGIARFNPVTGRCVRNYTVDDGLQGNEFSPNATAVDGEGRLYFGGVNGLTIFSPDLIGDSPFVPPVWLLSITQDGLPLNGDTVPELVQEVTLRWPQRSFEFEYSALSYAQPGKNQYAYMLENFDPDWNQVGERRDGRYTNLAGGNYILRIKASNQDGIWNENGISVRVTVVPPVWQTLWFQLAIAGGLLVLALTAYWARIKGIQSYNRELERQVRDRTQEIEKLFEKTKELAVIEERNRLARELHDSAKQKAFAALAQLGAANGILKKNPKAVKNHLVEAENLVCEVIEELTFLIQEMYPVALKERGLVATLREYVFEWEGRTDIQAEVRVEGEHRLNLNLEQTVYRVVQEALSNVSRHSRASHIDLVISYNKDEVIVIIADNGCGFDPQATPTGVGLRSIRERIESLGGMVVINSLPDCGTRLTVHLPC
jgi:ligand-binding sensor domain-containing protein/signal transduction histidine kinase